MTSGLPVILVLAAAVLVAIVRPLRARRAAAGRPRRGVALLVVTGLVGASVLLGTPAFAQSLECKEAPEPDRPGTGLVGSLDPPTYGVGEPGSVYYEVGYSGMVWHNYDLGCAGTAFNPASTTDTWLGNQAFNVAKFGVGGVNWAHYLISGGGDLLAPLDAVIRDATSAMYEAVFTTWIGPALVVLSVILLVLAVRGDLARQAQRTAFALAALMVGSAAYLTPVDWAKAADGLLLNGVTQMQEGFLSQVGLGDRDTLPTVLVDRVVYDNWLRGEFGSPEVPQAQQPAAAALQFGVVLAGGLERAVGDCALHLLALQGRAELFDALLGLGAVGFGVGFQLLDLVGQCLDPFFGAGEGRFAALHGLGQGAGALHQGVARAVVVADLALLACSEARSCSNFFSVVSLRDGRLRPPSRLRQPVLLGAGDQALAHFAEQLFRSRGARLHGFEPHVETASSRRSRQATVRCAPSPSARLACR